MGCRWRWPTRSTGRRSDAGFATDVVVEVGRYPFVVEELAYRIVREAVADARSHAGTSRIEVDIREHRGVVHGRIWDDGSGLPARRADDRPRALLHLSLERLGELVRLYDGDVEVRAIPGHGTGGVPAAGGGGRGDAGAGGRGGLAAG